MPRVSQNHDGSPKRRLQPIFLLDEPLEVRPMGTPHVHSRDSPILELAHWEAPESNLQPSVAVDY